MNAVQCPTMAAASGLSETMTLDDDSGAHEGNDEDNGDDAYGIESHGEQDAIARQVQLLLDLDRLGQIIARNRSNSADRCLACARDRPSMVGTTINRRDMNHSERNYEIQQLETSRHEAAKAVCLSAAALNDASITRALNHINDERDAAQERPVTLQCLADAGMRIMWEPRFGLDQHKAHWINHQCCHQHCNAEYMQTETSTGEFRMVARATRRIQMGEEIFANYNNIGDETNAFSMPNCMCCSCRDKSKNP